ncbi:MAG: NAD(P)-dependent oxidoreductase [Dermatophilaceae bacterium]
MNAYLALNAPPRTTPVQLTDTGRLYDRAVAEAALAGILAYYRQLPRLLVAQPAARWIKPAVEPAIRALDGQRVLILGAGAIAHGIRAPARRLQRARLFFLPHRPPRLDHDPHRTQHRTPPLRSAHQHPPPHTPATIGFLNHARLARLKRDAVVCNVGRGSTLDETALLALLDSGHLGGAVLDVTAIEPLPTDSPLWRHPKVLLTQHTGGRFPGETESQASTSFSPTSPASNAASRSPTSSTPTAATEPQTMPATSAPP